MANVWVLTTIAFGLFFYGLRCRLRHGPGTLGIALVTPPIP